MVATGVVASAAALFKLNFCIVSSTDEFFDN